MINNYALQTLKSTDLDIIFKWRNSSRIRSVMFNPVEIEWEKHVSWFEKLIESEKIDLVKVLLYKSKPIGLVNLSDIEDKTCNWGFYIGDKDTPKRSGQVMCYLAMEYLFEKLELDLVVGEVLEFNLPSRKLHEKLFFKTHPSAVKVLEITGTKHKVINYSLSKERWGQIKNNIKVELS